jgi:hypothetical protein
MGATRKDVIALVVLAASVSARASDWQFVAQSETARYSMDFQSVAPAGSYRKAWVKTILMNGGLKADSDPGKKYQSTKELYYFDCSAKRLSAVQSVHYSDLFGGEVVESSSVKFNSIMLDDVVPDSIGEMFTNVACSTPAERAKLRAMNIKRFNQPQ